MADADTRTSGGVEEGTELPPIADTSLITHPPPRRFTLADAMLVVAVMAAALFLLRIGAGLGLFTIDPGAKSPPGRDFVEHLSVGGGCVLVPLALTVVALSLRDGRPTRYESTHAPGFVACLAMLVAAILPAAYFVVRVTTADELNRANEIALNFNNSFGRLTSGAGPMIAGAWLALVLTGRWRPRPTWIDRLGRGIGGCFIIMYLYTELYFLLGSFHLW
jgi:hypothetical protein